MAEHVIVETTEGKVKGNVSQGVSIFKGIPYAGPASRLGRFAPPSKAEPWGGVRDAFEYGLAEDTPEAATVAA